MQTFDSLSRAPNLDIDGSSKVIQADAPSKANIPVRHAPQLPPVSPLPPRRVVISVLIVAGLITVGVLSYRWWHFAATHQETDNAYVSGDINPINARTAGTVIEVY
jgi:membrane fusion protein, multidrug efflux system